MNAVDYYPLFSEGPRLSIESLEKTLPSQFLCFFLSYFDVPS